MSNIDPTIRSLISWKPAMDEFINTRLVKNLASFHEYRCRSEQNATYLVSSSSLHFNITLIWHLHCHIPSVQSHDLSQLQMACRWRQTSYASSLYKSSIDTVRPTNDVIHVIEEEVASILFKQLPETSKVDFVTDIYLPEWAQKAWCNTGFSSKGSKDENAI